MKTRRVDLWLFVFFVYPTVSWDWTSHLIHIFLFVFFFFCLFLKRISYVDPTWETDKSFLFLLTKMDKNLYDAALHIYFVLLFRIIISFSQMYIQEMLYFRRFLILLNNHWETSSCAINKYVKARKIRWMVFFNGSPTKSEKSKKREKKNDHEGVVESKERMSENVKKCIYREKWALYLSFLGENRDRFLK